MCWVNVQYTHLPKWGQCKNKEMIQIINVAQTYNVSTVNKSIVLECLEYFFVSFLFMKDRKGIKHFLF